MYYLRHKKTGALYKSSGSVVSRSTVNGIAGFYARLPKSKRVDYEIVKGVRKRKV